jgi:hypothetical protein
MSFETNGGKFKLHTVLNGLFFPTPAYPRISFEREMKSLRKYVRKKKLEKNVEKTKMMVFNKRKRRSEENE